MLHIKLNEDTDFLDNDFLTKSDLPIDIQWKIYRGTLSRQSLPIKVYNKFQEQYDTFYDIYERAFDSEKEYDFKLATEIDHLGAALEKTYQEVEHSISKEARFELKICLEKIVNFLKDLREKVTNDQFIR